MSENYLPTLLWSKNRKYQIQLSKTVQHEGKNYHSMVVLTTIRGYMQQIDQGVNFSDTALQEYLNELA